LRYVAHAKGVALGKIAVSVTVELDGDPLMATGATMVVSCEVVDGSSSKTIIEEAKLGCMAINSLRKGIPVAVRTSA
jgi:organic hydroperoxide reductase OsmC/OhrA